MSQDIRPQLAPPGAGLPKAELYIARILFGINRRLGNREKFNGQFASERRRIAELVKACHHETGPKRVLIERVRGLEDSSRYWSVWMTLEHLRIVHLAIGEVIRKLSRGTMPEGVVSTAAVKPSPNVTADVINEYERSCDFLMEVVAATADLKTKLRHAHPWFGPLDASGWHALAAGHLGIHRAQIERIIQGLPRVS